MEKRQFLKNAGLGLMSGSAIISGCVECPKEKAVNINFSKKYCWKMTTTWPPNFPVLGEGLKYMAEWISKMSAGRIDITVYGGGELIPALEGFDAVSNATGKTTIIRIKLIAEPNFRIIAGVVTDCEKVVAKA